MPGLLESQAVGVQTGDNANLLLEKYIGTNPTLEQNMTAEARAAKQPKGMGAADAIDPTR